MAKTRSVEEVKKDILGVEADIAVLRTKGEKDELTAEEVNALTEKVDVLERLGNEKKLADAEQRYASIKVKEEEPARPLPIYRGKEQAIARVGQGFGAWLSYHSDEGDNSPAAYHKARELGFDPAKRLVCVPLDASLMNHKARHIARTVMTTSGAGSGGEWDYTNYSAKVFEHLTYGQPVLGFLNVESVPNGRDIY